MKFAASMRYAGMLVDAQEADYTSYKNLGLLCPICHAPVFLVSASERKDYTRSLTDKITGARREVIVAAASVDAHFSHFKDVSQEQVNQCELRVRALKPPEFHRRATMARNQREKYFRSHFWKLLEMGYKMETWEEDVAFAHSGFIATCPAKDPDNYRELKWTKISDYFLSYFKATKDYMVSAAQHCIDSLISKDVSQLSIAGFKPQTIDYLQQWRQAIDGRMQLEITKEAIDFLCHKRNKELVKTLLAKGLADYALNAEDKDHGDELLKPCALDQERLSAQMTCYTDNFKAIHSYNPKTLDSLMQWIFEDVAIILATTPWADGFERLEDKSTTQPTRTQLSTYSKGIWHYTINTGNTHFQPFSKLPESPIDQVREWIESIKDGGMLVKPLPRPYTEYSLKITFDPRVPGAALFDIGKGKKPSESLMLTAGVAWTKEGEEVLMNLLSSTCESVSSVYAQLGIPSLKLVKPNKLPWLAILLMPNLEMMTCPWLANAEYVIARYLMEVIG
jgi:hypothetical protein